MADVAGDLRQLSFDRQYEEYSCSSVVYQGKKGLVGAFSLDGSTRERTS